MAIGNALKVTSPNEPLLNKLLANIPGYLAMPI